MMRLFVLAFILWAVLLAASVFATFYWHPAAGALFMLALLVHSWLLARRIERAGRERR